MRVQRSLVLTAAVLGLVLLSGCRTDDVEGVPVAPSGSASGAEPTASAEPTADAAGRRVVDAATAGGLSRVTGDGAPSDVVVDPGEMRDGMNLVMNNYALAGGDPVLVVAVDNVPEETTERREHLWRGMLEHVKWDYGLGQPEAQPVEDAGPLGGSVECMLASLAEDGDVICGWADDTTAGVAHFPNSTLPEAAELFVAMRADLEK
ncbi:hypothetical protein [Streptomyces griseomycini]|uniref:Lipoprotein n=1 Tax=Streptomyces griseomycini TaxID=66895 RepID=A0A7W7PW57_9ACTN|nr:hypothetical protein [Streptomyces griseomycini]MBB4902447.1 hypothetical protein [Streptomyces griseomycini]GGR46312.1 hypothetical protein GCM10015536_60150 [Streptomyces griseomycini]